jgi:hypothetical protein
MALSYPAGHRPQAGDAPEINADQREVTLAPSRLVVTGRSVKDGLPIISVKAHEIPQDEVEGLIRDQSSDLALADAYQLFLRFFRQDSLRQAYEDLRDAEVVESAQPDGMGRDFVITRPGSAQTLTVTVRQEEGGTVRVLVSSSERKRPWPYSFTAENINLIGSYLRAQQLQESEAFEALPLPGEWYELVPVADEPDAPARDSGPAE